MSRYSDPQYVIGNTSHGMLRRIAHRLLNGPNNGKDRRVLEEYNNLEEDIRLGIATGELDTGHENQRHEMQGDDLENDYEYPCYELGDTTPPRGSSPMGGLPAPERSQTDDDISQDGHLAEYLGAQTDRRRQIEDFDRATTGSSQRSKALPPTPTETSLPVSPLSIPTRTLDGSSPHSHRESRESNATSLAYSVPVKYSPESSCPMITTQSIPRSCPHDEHSDAYSKSSSDSLLDYYTSEQESLIPTGPPPQLATSQRTSSPRSDPFLDSYTKYPDHPAFRLAPPVRETDMLEKATLTAQVSISKTFSKDQDMDGKSPGMEIELRPGIDEPKEHKQGPIIRQTDGNHF